MVVANERIFFKHDASKNYFWNQVNQLCDSALDFAARFQRDNISSVPVIFDSLLFLTLC